MWHIPLVRSLKCFKSGDDEGGQKDFPANNPTGITGVCSCSSVTAGTQRNSQGIPSSCIQQQFPGYADTDADELHEIKKGSKEDEDIQEKEGNDLRDVKKRDSCVGFWAVLRPMLSFGAFLGLFPAVCPKVTSDPADGREENLKDHIDNGLSRPNFFFEGSKKPKFPVLISAPVATTVVLGLVPQLLRAAKNMYELSNPVYRKNVAGHYGSTSAVAHSLYFATETLSGPAFVTITLICTGSLIRAWANLQEVLPLQENSLAKSSSFKMRPSSGVRKDPNRDLLLQERHRPVIHQRKAWIYFTFFLLISGLQTSYEIWSLTREIPGLLVTRGSLFSATAVVSVVLLSKLGANWWLFVVMVTAEVCRQGYSRISKNIERSAEMVELTRTATIAHAVIADGHDLLEEGKASTNRSVQTAERITAEQLEAIRFQLNKLYEGSQNCLKAIGPAIFAVVAYNGFQFCITTYLTIQNLKISSSGVWMLLQKGDHGLTREELLGGYLPFATACILGIAAVADSVGQIRQAELECVKRVKHFKSHDVGLQGQLQIHQILLEHAAFSADYSVLGFFDVNRAMLTAMAHAVTTYLVVLLQINESDGDQDP